MSSVNVLVVDDEQIIADTLSMILKTHGYTARAAYNAQDALVLAREYPPNVLISDVMMPGMNGIELAVGFADEFPQCRVLLMSGNAATADLLAQSEEQGHVHTILAKPVHPSHILGLLSTV